MDNDKKELVENEKIDEQLSNEIWDSLKDDKDKFNYVKLRFRPKRSGLVEDLEKREPQEKRIADNIDALNL